MCPNIKSNIMFNSINRTSHEIVLESDDDCYEEVYSKCSLCNLDINSIELNCKKCRTDICNECHKKFSVCQLKYEVGPEFWVENNMLQTIRNLNNKLKDILNKDK